jgi:hypothetical protein
VASGKAKALKRRRDGSLGVFSEVNDKQESGELPSVSVAGESTPVIKVA